MILSGTKELNLLSKKSMANCFTGSSAATFDASRTSLATSSCLHRRSERSNKHAWEEWIVLAIVLVAGKFGGEKL